MSLDATRWAWQQDLRPLQKLILLSLADRAGPDNSVWPSYDQIAADTGADRKTIWAAIKSFKDAGLVVDTGERKGRTGQVQVLRLVGVVDRHEEQPQKRNDSENGTVPFFPAKGSENGIVNSSENGIRNLPLNLPGNRSAAPGEKPPAADTSELPKPSKKNAKTSGSRLPEDWALPKSWGEWALKERTDWTADTVRKVAERFADHWHAKAGADARKADWQATWRNWVRREAGGVPAAAAQRSEARYI